LQFGVRLLEKDMTKHTSTEVNNERYITKTTGIFNVTSEYKPYGGQKYFKIRLDYFMYFTLNGIVPIPVTILNPTIAIHGNVPFAVWEKYTEEDGRHLEVHVGVDALRAKLKAQGDTLYLDVYVYAKDFIPETDTGYGIAVAADDDSVLKRLDFEHISLSDYREPLADVVVARTKTENSMLYLGSMDLSTGELLTLRSTIGNKVGNAPWIGEIRYGFPTYATNTTTNNLVSSSIPLSHMLLTQTVPKKAFGDGYAPSLRGWGFDEMTDRYPMGGGVMDVRPHYPRLTLTGVNAMYAALMGRPRAVAHFTDVAGCAVYKYDNSFPTIY
jgi:hypothetical protein